MTTQAIKNYDLWRYSFMAIPVAFAGFPLYVLAPDYYATKYGLSLSVLGFLLLILRLFDAFIYPFIGFVSDRYRSKSLCFMICASILLCASIYGLFNLIPTSPILWFSICMTFAVLAYGVLTINLNTLGGLWTNNAHEQTRITSLREGFALIGLVIAVSLPSLFKQQFDEQQAYQYYCLILILVMIVAWVLFVSWFKNNFSVTNIYESSAHSLLTTIKNIPKATCLLFSVYGLSMLASSLPAVLVLFFIRDLIGAESLSGLFLLLYFLSGACSMPLWKMLSIKIGKYRAWLLSMFVAVSSFIWAFFLGAGDVWQYALICGISGLALGADLSLPPSILADNIHRSHTKENAATQYALLALISKLSLAIASAIALPLLGSAGFVPAEENSESALFFLSTAYALIPCLLKLAAAILLWSITTITQKGISHEDKTINSNRWSTDHA